MKHFKEALDIFTQRKKDKAKRESEGSKQRVQDLFIKFYEFKPDIRIPIPSLWSIAKIDQFFGGQDKINYDNPEHIGRLLWILRNQESDKAVYMTADQIDAEIRDILKSIPAPQMELYQQAIYEMFLSLKKNSIRRQVDILRQAKTILDQE